MAVPRALLVLALLAARAHAGPCAITGQNVSIDSVAVPTDPKHPVVIAVQGDAYVPLTALAAP